MTVGWFACDRSRDPAGAVLGLDQPCLAVLYPGMEFVRLSKTEESMEGHIFPEEILTARLGESQNRPVLQGLRTI